MREPAWQISEQCSMIKNSSLVGCSSTTNSKIEANSAYENDRISLIADCKYMISKTYRELGDKALAEYFKEAYVKDIEKGIKSSYDSSSLWSLCVDKYGILIGNFDDGVGPLVEELTDPKIFGIPIVWSEEGWELTLPIFPELLCFGKKKYTDFKNFGHLHSLDLDELKKIFIK